MSFKRNFFKNGIATIFLKCLKISEQLLLVPFFILAWGSAYYGEWLTLTIIPTMLGLSDLGFGSAAANAFILKYASGHKQVAANIVASGFRTIHIVVITGVLLSVILLYLLSYFDVFDKSLIDEKEAVIAMSFLMLARLLAFYQQLFDAFFKAARKASLSINLLGGYSALNLVGALIVLSLKGGIVAFACVNFCSAVVFLIIYSTVARKTLKDLDNYKGQIYNSDIKMIVSKGFGYLLSPVWQAIFFQGTTFVVRIVLGPVAVTLFNTIRTATRAVNQANTIVINSVMPELQFEIGSNNLSKARKIFRLSFLATIFISILGMTLLYFFGLELYEIWTQKALMPPVLLWNIFILGIVFNAVWWFGSDILIFSNRPYDFTIAAVIIAIVSVITSYFLSDFYGITGAAIGSLLLDILLMIYVLPKSLKRLEQPTRSFIRDIFIDLNKIWKVDIKPTILKIKK